MRPVSSCTRSSVWRVKAFLDPKMGNRFAPVAAHRHAGANAAVPTDRFIDPAAASRRPDAQRQVFATDLARRQRRHQPRVRGRCPRHDQYAAGVLVEPMHEPGSRHACEVGVVRQQCVLQRVRAIAGTGMHDQPGRLVQYQQGCVLVQNVERQPLGSDRGHRRGIRL